MNEGRKGRGGEEVVKGKDTRDYGAWGLMPRRFYGVLRVALCLHVGESVCRCVYTQRSKHCSQLKDFSRRLLI